MKAGQKKKVYSVEERLAHVAAFKASGKSLREYEMETGVKDQTLYNWVSGRNLKTQAKKAEVKKAEVKKQVKKQIKVIARVEAPTPTPVVPPRSERFWAWYENARPNLVLGTDGVLIALLALDLIARHK
jgi:transposase-like protein